jgi:signal transduction histidine kinase
VEFIIFIPLFVYDCTLQKKRFFKYSWVLPLLVHLSSCSPIFFAAIILFCVTAWLLRHRTSAYQRIEDEFHQMQDRTKEKALHLERKNHELMEKQDYEVRLATLRERNRIAREIHDNVGHLLTRSILQVSALQVVSLQDEKTKEELTSIKSTLSHAMDSIRSSVHDLHEESIDLKIQLCMLIDEFKFCPVKLNFDAGKLPKELKYCFIAIVREALSNITKHSNATAASVTVLEHPALYQLIIEDNGSAQVNEDQNGIGLLNMKERVDSFRGVFRINKDKGFKIFISIPKERQ